MAAGHAGSAPVRQLSVVTGGTSRPAQRNALFAVMVFIVVAIGLWAALGYLNQTVAVLTSINDTNAEIYTKMSTATEGLKQLDTKTANLAHINAKAGQLQTDMSAINGDMDTMLHGVNAIATGMAALNTELTALDGSIGGVAETNEQLSGRLGTINTGLQTQAEIVAGMRADLVATAAALRQVTPALKATNARLAYLNKVVCHMGANGIRNTIKVSVYFLNIPNGSADIFATIVPAGSWKC